MIDCILVRFCIDFYFNLNSAVDIILGIEISAPSKVENWGIKKWIKELHINIVRKVRSTKQNQSVGPLCTGSVSLYVLAEQYFTSG